MVTNRTITLTFSWASTTKDADGFVTNGTPSTLALLCRPEPAGPNKRVAAPGGDFVQVEFKIFTDTFTSVLPVGATVTVNGKLVRVLQVYQYQLNAEIWVG